VGIVWEQKRLKRRISTSTHEDVWLGYSWEVVGCHFDRCGKRNSGMMIQRFTLNHDYVNQSSHHVLPAGTEHFSNSVP
jgi:hypothetical protein